MWLKLNVDSGFSWLLDTRYYMKGETVGRKYSPNVSNTFNIPISFAVRLIPKKYKVLHTKSSYNLYEMESQKLQEKEGVRLKHSIGRKQKGMKFNLSVVPTIYRIRCKLTCGVGALVLPTRTRVSERPSQRRPNFQFQALKFKASASRSLGSQTHHYCLYDLQLGTVIDTFREKSITCFLSQRAEFCMKHSPVIKSTIFNYVWHPYIANEAVGQMMVTNTLRTLSMSYIWEWFFTAGQMWSIWQQFEEVKYYFITECWDPPKQTRLFLRSFPSDQESTHQSEWIIKGHQAINWESV